VFWPDKVRGAVLQTLSQEKRQAIPAHSIVLEPLKTEFDPAGRHVARQAQESGFGSNVKCTACRLFFLQGELTPDRLNELTSALLLDPVVERVATDKPDVQHTVDVAYLPGVTDTEGENLLKAAHQLGFIEVTKASRATRYYFQFEQPVSVEKLEQFVSRELANEVIETHSVDKPISAPFIVNLEKPAVAEPVPLRSLNSEDLVKLSTSLRLALDLSEMESLQNHYEGLGKEPTRCELETFAQTWSEHCVHKTFRASIEYTENGKTTTVDGLLPILRKATEELNLDWVVSAFVDNAGIVNFTPEWDIAIKAETHNHPSALEPFGGANTGIGGVIRDILGVSARPFANWDVLCFGPLEATPPEGSLPARKVMTGVVRGIADYGNKMGIPTVAGGVYFHEGYLANPLVYAGCLGILPHAPRPTEVKAGDRIVLIGGKTGRDGLGGATFSSLEMDTTTAQECGTAVQIGHPIAEKVASVLLLQAFEEGLYNAVTDCGAGGLASAIGEMADELGAVVHLERVPTKYPGLSPRELWLSEAQERMVCSVPAEKWSRLKVLAEVHDTVCVDLGHFGNDGRLQLFYEDVSFADLSTDFLHGGIPRRHLKAEWSPPNIQETPVEVTPEKALLALLADPNICSREPLLRYYDFEVQGGTSIKPLTDKGGPSDGTAVVPYEWQSEEDPPAVVLGCGLNPWLTELDPRLGTLSAIDEAIRNIVSVGADPSKISLLDNFSWGNPKLPDRLGKLTRSVLACAEGSKLYKAPFVSGKDSLNNEFKLPDGTRRAIPGTILISAVGCLPKVSLRVPSNFQNLGDIIYLLGPEQNALGGSAYLRRFEGSSSEFPESYDKAPEMYAAFHQAVTRKLVESCHDLSEGGLAVALAECCLSSDLGALVTTASDTLFGEGPSRLLVTVTPENESDFLESVKGFPTRRLGLVTGDAHLSIEGVMKLSVSQLKEAFKGECFAALAHTKESRPQSGPKDFSPIPPAVTGEPKVAVLRAPGINREQDVALAVKLAGGRPEFLDPQSGKSLKDYAMVVLPGGFSFGDDLGAGRLWALSLQPLLDELRRFALGDGAILGICNGFQALLKSGLLLQEGESATLAFNDSDHFECRWVDLEICSGTKSVFTEGLNGFLRCPVAHGEGRLLTSPEQARDFKKSRTPLLYSEADYPMNPNGSLERMASLCNARGNVMGLMPHPENNVLSWQSHPGDPGAESGLALFRNALRNLS
jgi:phosphoribosylformylglycinamidine synthase II/phosphoribosylformylglycinamidine synthase I